MPKAIPTVVIFACLIPGVLLGQTTQPILQTYRSVEHGFQMDYLSLWKVETGTEPPWIVVRFVPGSQQEPRLTRARGAVGIPPLPNRQPGQPIGLDDVALGMIAEMKRDMPDARVGVAVDTTLSGEPARRMIITGNVTAPDGTPIPLRSLVIAAVHRGKPYVVGIVATEEDWARMRSGFDRIIQSFRFVDTPG